jgi:glycine betaine/choline ABC-type transport system substrate-binding protein
MKNATKTILEWLQQAKADGYEWADAAIENAITELSDLEEISLSEALAGAFEWESSEQGHEYWEKIYVNLVNSGK